jgi:5-(carboxyamino)imidazole ribonucleotide synthase
VVEDLVDIEKELSVIVAADAFGRVVPFPLVDMVFHPEANLVELLQCPAMIEPHLEREAMLLAEDCLKAFNTRGLLAVELFLDKKGRLFINEVAPRAHNSGHHTIESCTTSQFEQHIRSVMGYPLGDTRLHSPAVMVNILGEPGFEGPVVYEGLDAAQALPGVHIHLYGKAITKPFRKMGHVTITAETPDEAIEIARKTQREIKVRS